MLHRKFIPITVISLSCLLFIGFNIFLFKWETEAQPLPVLGKVQDFTLTDLNRQPFGSNNLQGKVWVANFFFTTCSGICPVMNKNIAALTRSFQMTGNVHFVSISVNPEQDTPEALKAYAAKFPSDNKRWHFLTGPRDMIQDLSISSFKIGSIDEPMFHSANLVLVDRYMQIRGYYDGTDQKAIQKLFTDLAQLTKKR